MKRLNVAVTKLTGRVSRSRIAHRRGKSWVPGWRCVDIHENRIQPAASLPAEGPKHSKKSNFPWRRGRALQQVPFHSVLQQVHRRHCFNAQRRGLLWEEQKAPLSRFASPYYQRCHTLSLSSGTLHRPTVSSSPKKRLILVGVSTVVEKRNKKKSPNFPDNRRILALGWFLSLCRSRRVHCISFVAIVSGHRTRIKYRLLAAAFVALTSSRGEDSVVQLRRSSMCERETWVDFKNRLWNAELIASKNRCDM